MNLLLVQREEMAEDGTISLQDRRARHLLEVLQVSPGQRLRAGILGEANATAEVLSIGESVVRIRLTAGSEPTREPEETRLVLALPRPKALRRVIQNAACMGVTELDLVNAWRVSSSYFSSPILTADRLRHEAILGAEQGGHFRIPKIRLHRLFMPFVESLGPGADELRLLAHPTADDSLAEIFTTVAHSKISLAIGPEGGWIDREIASLRGRAYQAFRLGDSILRSEIAVTAAIAQIDLLRGMASRYPSDR